MQSDDEERFLRACAETCFQGFFHVVGRYVPFFARKRDKRWRDTVVLLDVFTSELGKRASILLEARVVDDV